VRDFKNDPKGLEVNITCSEATLVQHDTLLALDYCGDGYYGPYDFEDPDDMPFLRLSAYNYHATKQTWERAEHASWVTCLPAVMPEEHQEVALSYLMQRMYYSIMMNDVQELGNQLAWIDPSWIFPDAEEDAIEEAEVVDEPAEVLAAVGLDDVEVEVELDALDTPYAPTSTAVTVFAL